MKASLKRANISGGS